MSDENQRIVDVLIRLAQGDLGARVERTFDRGTDDAMAYCINVLATEFERLVNEREQNVRYLEDAVSVLSDSFVALAAGDYEVRVPRTRAGDPVDELARLFNETAIEVQRAVVALEEQRSVLEATLEAMLDPVLLLDPSGEILRANGAAASLFGRGADALMGESLGALVADDEQAFVGTLATQVAQRALRDRETAFRVATGRAALPMSASGHRDAEGRVKGIVVLVRDDRDLRAARAQLQMTDRLAAMGTIAAGVAHEINNPLAFVLSNLEFLLEELSPDALARLDLDATEVREALTAAHRGSERVRLIVQDLRSFSRTDGDSFRPVDVNQLITSAVAMLDNEVRHHARVVLALGDVPRVEANEAKLGQVFLNLVHNAAQAIPPGHASENTITVRSGTDARGHVVVSVQDTGQGIELRHRERIFDAFFTTKPVGVGTGLGLSICHQVVSKLGGQITVESVVGAGTTFRVSLPPSQRPDTEPDASAPEAGDAPRRRVLVIDDEVEVGQSVRRILRRRHDVDVVQRADVALRLLDTTPFDVILCDVMMPEMTGMEFYERLGALHPELLGSVVFMSGGAFSPEAREFLKAQRGPTLEKPFETRALRKLIDEVTGDA